MTRIILIYGPISGLVAILGILATILTSSDGHGSVWLGYLIMLVALSSILLGVKQYRDQALGGVIRFRTAFLMGLGIAVVAAVAYAAVWEVYLAVTNYTFMDKYVAETLEAKRAAGLTDAAYEKTARELETMRLQYKNPFLRVPMTMTEIFPVGLLIALVSAALLRNPRFLPARSPAA